MTLIQRLRKWIGRGNTEEHVSVQPRHNIVPATVLGLVTGEATLRVILSPGSGMADGGIPREIPLARVPPALRVPNTKLQIILDLDTHEVLVIKAAP